MNDQPVQVYIESVKKRTFAGAIDWPGWQRSGKDEAAALRNLLAYGQRYAQAIQSAGLGYEPPQDLNALVVVERMEGNSTTDFGAPDAIPEADTRPFDQVDLQRFQALLRAIWTTFDSVVQAASDCELRLGPRGGGRDLDEIVRHVWGGELAYLGRLGRGFSLTEAEEANSAQVLNRVRQAVMEALEAGFRGELPEHGPRGGKRWPPRFYVRRSAWHVLDHAWEIEDRMD